LPFVLLSSLALFSCAAVAQPSPTPSKASTARGEGTGGGGGGGGTAWVGTIDSVTFRVYTDNNGKPGNRCQSTWHSTVAFRVTARVVVGQGTSKLVGKGTCAPIAAAEATQFTNEKFGITGTQQGQSLHLFIAFRSGGGGMADLGGEALLNTLSPCSVPLVPREIVVSMQSADTAVGSADADITITCGGGAADQFSNHSRISLQVVK
jgi:hypothetical protein